MTALPDYVKRGTFEMACADAVFRRGKFVPVCTYKTEPGYLVGRLVAHRIAKSSFRWGISHAGVGFAIPGAYARTLGEAARVARALDGAVDWDMVKRGRRIDSPTALTNDMRESVIGMIQSFRHLRPALMRHI